MNDRQTYNITETQRDDRDNWFHPWEGMANAGTALRTVITKAEGIYVFDEQNRRLIDGPGGMWCMQIGYGRKDMAQTIYDQVIEMPYMNPFSLTSSPTAQLAGKLAELAPGDLNHVFFTTCGSTAVDTALRLVHFYNNVKGRPNKKHIISRDDAYHGSTYLCALVTGKDRDKNWFDVASPLVHFLSSVNPSKRPKEQSLAAFCDAKVNELEQKILQLGADNVGAFIAEPIQASGGVIVPPDGYYKRCWEICRKHDVLFIADEVVTAFGRLGHFFASKDVFGVEPDMITCAKGLTSGYLPMGALLVSDRIFKEISGPNARGSSFGHGYTYSGHPVCSAAALKSIAIIEQEKILDHVREIGPYFQKRLQELRDIALVADVRGMGLVGCVECTVGALGEASLEFDTDLGARIDAHCHELGLMVRPIVNKCVFSPPLIITREQIDTMVDILKESIIRTMHDIQHELGIELV